MTVSPTIATRTSGTVRFDRIASRLAHSAVALVALVAFGLLAGVWLAYFMVVPLDFTVR
jgi:hypothetical protein